MLRKRVKFGDFEVPIPKGHHSDIILGDCEEGSTLELKLPNRRIVLRGGGIY